MKALIAAAVVAVFAFAHPVSAQTVNPDVAKEPDAINKSTKKAKKPKRNASKAETSASAEGEKKREGVSAK